MNEPHVAVLAGAEALAAAAAERVAATLRDSVARRGLAHLALTGGSTAPSLYRRLASSPLREAVPWRQVHLWWGDERYVPRDHPDSNAGVAEATLLGAAALTGEAHDGSAGTDVEAGLRPGVLVPVEHVHPWPVERAMGDARGPDWAAAEYAAELVRALPLDAGGRPIFDLLLLGVGQDGHILSVFPGSAAFLEGAPLALAVPAPEHVRPHVPRLTLAPGIVGAARAILVMAVGEAKAEVLRAVLTGPREDVARLPARAARLASATWLLDAAAAAALPPGVASVS
ncbi:MAG: 6-phosphogluconolactonase [Candidatus Limnocylindrales bacterium]